MRVTICYDNEASRPDLIADWGFSALVETRDARILFDTGARGGILLSNMAKLGVVPESIPEIFISHAHFDHVGGLSAMLERNPDVTIYAPPSFRGVRGVREVRHLADPASLHDGLASTGELAGIEQSLVVETHKGLVVLVGCSHPPMSEILAAASRFGRVYGIVGGLHGFRDFDLFEGLGLVAPAHCTRYKRELRERFPDAWRAVGAGTVLEV